MNPNVDTFLSKATKWRDETAKLRQVCLDCGLTEELKWYKPCYTFQNNNVVIIIGFKEYCSFNFFKGALLSDVNHVLVKIGENSQAGRKIPFTSVQEIEALESILKAYLCEAIEVEKAGLEVTYKKASEFVIPEELQSKLEEAPAFKAAFDALTPGRQRAYIMHFSAPKQSKTRTARIEKSMPDILEGKGMNDDYIRSVRSRR